MSIPTEISTHPSLLGIIRFPKSYKNSYYTGSIPITTLKEQNGWMTGTQPITWVSYIESPTQESASFSVKKSEITDFYPYTYYLLADGEAEPLEMKPQFLPSSFKIIGKHALSNTPVERYFPSNYKGSTDGTIYNITNTNLMMLPIATNEGVNNIVANNNAMGVEMDNMKRSIPKSFLNGVSNAGNLIGAITALGTEPLNAIENLNKYLARTNDILTTPNTLKSWGTPSTRDNFDNNRVRVIKYTIQDKYKTKINNFCDRYGYKFNAYKIINHTTYKGYVQMVAPDIDSGIDNMYIQKIKSILERGIKIE